MEIQNIKERKGGGGRENLMRQKRTVRRTSSTFFLAMTHDVVGGECEPKEVITLKKKSVSEVGFEPTPTYVDQNALTL